MGITNFDTVDARDGLRSRGVPILGSGDPVWWTKGNVYHVDSGHAAASDDNDGTDPDYPMATLNGALAKCTANNGDLVLVAEGHAETLATAAASPDLDVAGVTVICLGTGEARAAWTFTHVDASLKVSAANCRMFNPLFKCNVDSLKIVVDVNAKDFQLVQPEIREGSAKQFLVGIDVNGGAANACDRAKIISPKIVQIATGGNAAIELGEVADEVEIVNAEIDGDWTDAGIHNPVGKILTNLRLSHNTVRNRQAGDHAIELVSACTGWATDNRLIGDTLGTIFDPGSLMCLGNLETDAVDQAGVDSPRTSAGGLPADSVTAAAIATDAIDADALAADAVAEIADGVLDEVVSGHVATLGTVGRVLAVPDSGTAQAGGAGSLTLAATASATSGLYIGCVVQITGGTGVGQTALITAYNGGTKVATTSPAWALQPDNTSTYVVRPWGFADVQAMLDGVITAAKFAAGAINAAALAADAVAEIADGVLDEAVSGHVTSGSVGAMLQPLHGGTAQAGAAGTITLAAGAVATDDYYNGAVVQLIGGTGAGQSRAVTDYTGATKVANVAPNWATTPDNTSVYVVHALGPVVVNSVATGAVTAAAFAAGAIDAAAIANGAIDAATFAAGAVDAAALAADAVAEVADGVADEAVSGHVAAGSVGAMLQPLHSGTAQAGAAGTVTLAAGASATNDLYNGSVIQVISGTGVGQIRLVTDYDGGTKVATVAPNWTTNPANDSVYVVHGAGTVRVDAITDGLITAAAIATGAVDADAIADNAIDAAALAADAITNAKIADNALATEQFALSAGEKTTEGIVVTRATAALPQSTSADIFTVTGLCLLKRIVGYVTVGIGNVANATKLKVNSTGAGATTDICGTLDIDNKATDNRFEITGTFANAMVATLDLPLAKVQVTEVVIPPGTIMVDCAGSDGGGGRVRWSVTYVPMESGAQIVAA